MERILVVKANTAERTVVVSVADYANNREPDTHIYFLDIGPDRFRAAMFEFLEQQMLREV